jgi:hypothetical protein
MNKKIIILRDNIGKKFHSIDEYLENLQILTKCDYDFVEFKNPSYFCFKIIKSYDIAIICNVHPSLYNIIKNFFEKSKKKVELYFFNMEQLSHNDNETKLTDDIKNVVDYSYENISLYNEQNKKNIIYFPYYVPKKEIYNYDKVYNVCTVGNLTDRRKKMIEKIPGINVISNLYGQERDELLFRHKILVNIHAHEYFQIHESIRCDRCVLNKMIIITEKSIKYEENFLYKYMIYVDFDEIPDKIKDVTDNYEYYYKKIFIEQDFDIFMNKYEDKIKSIYDENLKKIMNS